MKALQQLIDVHFTKRELFWAKTSNTADVGRRSVPLSQAYTMSAAVAFAMLFRSSPETLTQGPEPELIRCVLQKGTGWAPFGGVYLGYQTQLRCY